MFNELGVTLKPVSNAHEGPESGSHPVNGAAPLESAPHPRPRTLLVLSQVFIPDPASLGQHMADATIEMARRGHRVRVYAANHGYENAAITYPARETIKGVEVRRLPLCSFGKKNIFARLAGTLSFMTQAFFAALFTPEADAILFSTSPPLIGFVASLAAMIRGVPTAYWAMDLNPDQLIAMGKIGPRGIAAGVLREINRFILFRSSIVIALDRFMAERLERGANLAGKLLIMPPWPHENYFESVEPAANPFRIKHGLIDKFVVMYSGNHSPANPLDTFLNAIVRFKDDPGIRFLFVGGGQDKKKVEEIIHAHGLTNTLSLPYQPLEELRFSLTAADVHVVSLGDDMVGIVHPCKIYGAIANSRPVLFFGPKPSHISDLLDRYRIGWHVFHGDVEKAVATLHAIRETSAAKLNEMGQNARKILDDGLSQHVLCARFCDALENHLDLRDPGNY